MARSLLVLVFSGTHGSGFGAERVLEHLLGSPRMTEAIGGIIAPKRSAVFEAGAALGYRVFDWPSPSNSTLGNLVAFARVRRELASVAPGVGLVHAWHTRGFEWGLALGRILRIPATGTLHDDPAIERQGPARGWMIRAAAHRLRRMAVVSAALARRCEDLRWSANSTIIRNGLPDMRLDTHRRHAPSVLRVGFLGSNEAWKGHRTLCATMAALQNESIEWHIFGSLSEKSAACFRELIASPPPRVVVHGRRPAEEIYDSVDVIFHPSESFDPYPTALLEAARAALPVVATRTGGSEEIVDDGKTGVLICPEDTNAAVAALRLLLQNPSDCAVMAENAREKFEREFNLSNMASAYRAFWTQTSERASVKLDAKPDLYRG